MVAIDPSPSAQPPTAGGPRALSAQELSARLEEEVSRAEREGTALACLLLMIENLEEMAREHGSDLSERTLAYVAGALLAQLRRFDRVGRPGDAELVVVLPGADGLSGELVARRILERLHTIKVETRGARNPLQVSLGLAAWHADMSSDELLERSRAATRRPGGENGQAARPERERGTGVGGGAQPGR